MKALRLANPLNRQSVICRKDMKKALVLFLLINIAKVYSSSSFNSIDLGVQMPFTVAFLPVPEIKLGFIRNKNSHSISIEGLFVDRSTGNDIETESTKRLLFHLGTSYNYARRIRESNFLLGGNFGFLMSLASSNVLENFNHKDGAYFGGPLFIWRKEFEKIHITIEDKFLIGYGTSGETNNTDSSIKILNSLGINIGFIYKRTADNRVTGGFSPPVPTPPAKRVRNRRFI